jgi:hypothetical protein
MHFTSRHTLTLVATVFGAWLALAPAARGHPGQHMGLKITIDDREVAQYVTFSNDFLRTLTAVKLDELKLSLEDNGFRFDDPTQEEQMQQAVGGLFDLKTRVTIDGVVVKPILRQCRFILAVNSWGLADPAAPPDAEFVLVYPTKGRPKQVAMVWELYPQDPIRAASGGALGAILAELDAYAESQLVMFTPEEPEVIWHAPGKPIQQRVQPVVAAVEPTRIPIPLLSLAVMVFWAVCVLWLRFASIWPRVRRSTFCFSLVPIAIAVCCHNVLAVPVAAPWGENVRLPDAREATDIFTALHRNVYRAFDYKTESDIYDVLSQSVAGDLLDRVYNEVYQSLIMRDQGGAVARVHSVDVLDTELVSAGRLPDSNRAAFKIRSRWQVYGVVTHWGHFHSRTNEYEALYTVAQLEDKWKITGIEVLDQRRVAASDGSSVLPTRPTP